MEIRVPVFAGRRILKKESLWDIRDYTYAGWQLYYADHTDGCETLFYKNYAKISRIAKNELFMSFSPQQR